MADLNTHYLEYDLETVMRYFIDGFEPPEGRAVLGSPEWFVDPSKRKVIFRLMTQPKDE
jgi:hypothetical protein